MRFGADFGAPELPSSLRPRRRTGPVLAAMIVASVAIVGWADAADAARTTPTPRDYQFRKEFGLTTDPIDVNAIVATNAASTNWGVSLSDAEEAELAERGRIVDQAPALRDALAKLDGFAGLWVDQAAGGVIEVLMTAQGSTSIRDRTNALAPAGSKYRFREVPNSLATLNILREQFRQQMSDVNPSGPGITRLSVDLKRNAVVVGLEPSTFDSAVASLARTVSAGPVIYEPAERLKTAACVSRQNCPPLRAGLDITDPAHCTSNFTAFAGATFYLLTAGHCGAVGNVFRHNGNIIGTVNSDAYVNGTTADVLSIDLSDNSNKTNLVYVNLQTQRPMTSKMPLNGDVVGSPACGSGIKTGFFCGAVLDTDQDGLGEGNVVIHHLQIASINVRQGDSGGPIFYGNKAMGVTSLVNGNVHGVAPNQWWDNLMFSQVRDEEIRVGLTVWTGQ